MAHQGQHHGQRQQGAIAGGQAKTLHHLQARPEGEEQKEQVAHKGADRHGPGLTAEPAMVNPPALEPSQPGRQSQRFPRMF